MLLMHCTRRLSRGRAFFFEARRKSRLSEASAQAGQRLATDTRGKAFATSPCAAFGSRLQ